jgi:alanine-synthesizing transaminase
MSESSAGKRRFARIDRLPPYVFNVTAELKLAARRRGEDIIDLSMGNPDGPTPPHIVAKLVDAAQRPDTHGYSTSKGIPRLRHAISHWYQERYGAAIDPDHEAVVTIGSKEGLAHLMLAALDRGDTVLVRAIPSTSTGPSSRAPISGRYRWHPTSISSASSNGRSAAAIPSPK